MSEGLVPLDGDSRNREAGELLIQRTHNEGAEAGRKCCDLDDMM